MNLLQDINAIEQKVVDFFKGIPAEAQDVLSASNKFLNTIKVLSTSATGQTVIDLGEAFFPATTGVVSGAEAILSELLGITAETPGQLLLQASQKATSLTGTAKVAAFSSIATAIGSAANAASKGVLTDQQIVSVNQVVHDATALDVPAVVVPVAPAPVQSAGQGNAPAPVTTPSPATVS